MLVHHFSHYYSRRCWWMLSEVDGVINFSMFGELFGHNRSRSQCFQIQPVSCCDLPYFFIHSRHNLSVPLTWLAIFLKSWFSAGYFSNSTGSYVSSGRFSMFIVGTLINWWSYTIHVAHNIHHQPHIKSLQSESDNSVLNYMSQNR